MRGCVNIRLALLLAKLLAEENYIGETKKDLAQLLQILKDNNYPLVELVDILSIVMMLDYILSDKELIVIYGDFISLSLDVIAYILSGKTYLKIEEKIIFLEYEFYTNICNNSWEFEDTFIEELKKLIMISKNMQ